MKRLFPALALLILLASASEANACGGWCLRFFANVFGQQQPPAPDDERVPLRNDIGPQQYLAIGAPDLQEIPLHPNFQLDESQIRKAFDIAYPHLIRPHGVQSEGYQAWKQTIRTPNVDTEQLSAYIYNYEPDPEHRINARLDTDTGVLEFQISSSVAAATRVGRALALGSDNRTGLFSRAFVAFGGTTHVKSLLVRWTGRDFVDFQRQMDETGLDEWTSANSTFPGRMARLFYGFTAENVSPLGGGYARLVFGPSQPYLDHVVSMGPNTVYPHIRSLQMSNSQSFRHQTTLGSISEEQEEMKESMR